MRNIFLQQLLYCLKLIFFAALIVLPWKHTAYAQLLQVSVRGIQIDTINVEQGKITGSFSILNEENRQMDGLRYAISVFNIKEGNNESAQVLLEQQDGGIVSVKTGEEKQVPFSFSSAFPEPQGAMLRISLLGKDFSLVSQSETRLVFSPGKFRNIFIELDPFAKLLFGEREVGRFEGINISSDSNPNLLTIRVKARNLANERRTVVPRVKTYERNVPNLAADFILEESYEFGPGEEKEIILHPRDPSVAKPGSYVAAMTLVDKNNPDIQLSSIMDARYVITGVSATILDARFDKSAYKAGEKGVLTATYIGPADFSSATAEIETQIFNQNNALVFKETKQTEIGPSAAETVFEFTQKKENKHPWARLAVRHNGNTLAEYRAGNPGKPFPFFTAIVVSFMIVIVGGVYAVVTIKKVAK